MNQTRFQVSKHIEGTNEATLMLEVAHPLVNSLFWGIASLAWHKVGGVGETNQIILLRLS